MNTQDILELLDNDIKNATKNYHLACASCDQKDVGHWMAYRIALINFRDHLLSTRENEDGQKRNEN